nr:PAS domain S-box protein [Aridibaculum aurantiacum]
MELEKLVQRVTDIGTQSIGAAFGAFFYSKVNANNESLILYTISGVDKEAFSKFPMPRNTKIFEPTFMASGTVRYDDVTAQPHYAQNPPYHGMPKGHLPVKSYLAVPVVSPINNEPIGGLFFGHPDAGVFTKEAEQLVEGLAIQAAIAMGNAKLFEEKKHAERILLEQKEQYESIFNATSDSLIIYDENGYIVEANPSACDIFGYEYKELIGLHASRLFYEPKDFETLKTIAFTGRKYSGSNTRITKDGSLIEVKFVGSQFLYKGKPHVLSAVKDVTASKKTEEALQKSQEFAEAITDVSPVALWMTDTEGQTIYINKTLPEWVGRRMQDLLQSGWLSVVYPGDHKQVEEKFNDAFARREALTIDFRVQRVDGEIRWCSTHGSPYHGKDGRFAGFAGSVMDITERKIIEEQLTSQNILINTITNNTLQALFFMDDRQHCTYMNPAAEKMIGYKLEEIQEKPLHYYIHHTHPDGRHFPIEECEIDRALPKLAQTQGDEVFIKKDGSFFPVSFIASPIIQNGKPVGTVIEVRDTTEEKRIKSELRDKEKKAMAMLEQKVKERTRELEKSNYELLQFTSVASHDLKEPVRKISIFSNLLKELNEASLDDRSLRYLDNIAQSSTRMARLIDDLLNFSRLSQSELAFSEVNLNKLVTQVLEDLEIQITEKGATINFHELPVVMGIEFQLAQLFQNLLSNSLKFAHPDRRPVINITAKALSEGNKQVYKIFYRDNGIGFKPEYNEKIFGVFQRLHTKDQYEGTGVGLAIVKKIISLHNGEIIASGVEGEGALFEITLPADEHLPAAS